VAQEEGGIGQVALLDEVGDVQYAQEEADEKRFALRKSPQAGEFGGFSVHAGVTVDAADKDGRERLIRYCARPALSMERMTETSDGLIAYRLRHTQKGRASHRVMRPIDFLARIAAIIPPPRHPLLRYFGVFGPHSSFRRLCVAEVGSTQTEADSDGASASQDRKVTGLAPGATVVDGTKQSPDPPGQDALSNRTPGSALDGARIDWATLLKRTYDLDVLKCPCGGRLKAVELVTDAERAKELLVQFGMSTKPPPIARARSPDWN
jgi:hypothetical protein